MTAIEEQAKIDARREALQEVIDLALLWAADMDDVGDADEAEVMREFAATITEKM